MQLNDNSLQNVGKISILFEDEDLLVLNKPARMVVNDAMSAPGETVQQWVRLYLARETSENIGVVDHSSITERRGHTGVEWQSLVPQDFDNQYGSPEEIFAQRGGMVHRLDKETSGILLWAKNPGSQVELLRQFREREVQKTYECLVHGRVEEREGEVDAPIERSSQNRQRFAVSMSGRPAVTQYQVVAYYQLDLEKFVAAARQVGLFAGRPASQVKEQLVDYLDYTYLRCQPKTGRTHQIRVHCQHIGHSLVGDQLYQGRKRIKLDDVWCSRHFLHAASIIFVHPRTYHSLEMTAPLSSDLDAILQWLGSATLLHSEPS